LLLFWLLLLGGRAFAAAQLGLHLGVRGGGLLKRALQLLVGLLLDRLGVLQLLDQLHLDALHVQHLVLLVGARDVLLLHLHVLVAVREAHLAALLFFLLHLGEALLLVHDLVLHFVFGFDLELVVADLLLVLSALDLRLLGLLRPREVDCLLHLALLVGTLLLNHVVLVRGVPLHLDLLLHFSFFLQTLASS
jgi:hypothetical protein